MKHVTRRLGAQGVEVRFPDDFEQEIRLLVGDEPPPDGPPGAWLEIRTSAGTDDCHAIATSRGDYFGNLDRSSCLSLALNQTVTLLLHDLHSDLAVHAGAVGCADGLVLIPGPSGAGKTSLCAWFAVQGYDYYTDEIVITPASGAVAGTQPRFSAFARPCVFKGEAPAALIDGGPGAAMRALRIGDITAGVPNGSPERTPQAHRRQIIIFATFRDGAPLSIRPLTPARTALRLMGCNVNARNLPADGFHLVTRIAEHIPAIELTYGDTRQIDGVLDALTRMILRSGLAPTQLGAALGAFAPATPAPSRRPPATTAAANPIPEPTARKLKARLTIGMATFDDYDGVYFTIQALRLFHPEIANDAEFLVIDNNPTGPCSAALKRLEDSIANYRYVPEFTRTGTAIRDRIFAEAGGAVVLCMDCHVLIVPGAVKKLIDWFEAHPESRDLVQGPLIYDNLEKLSSHFAPHWRSGMYGTWELDEAAADVDGEPFDIPMQGLGLFACRKVAWPGFNEQFRGFGGEEGYIHEKFRRAGGRTLCLPFLRWLHRFERPMGVRYPNVWEERIRNYFIGFRELGLDTAEMEQHFRELIGEDNMDRLMVALRAEFEDGSTTG